MYTTTRCALQYTNTQVINKIRENSHRRKPGAAFKGVTKQGDPPKWEAKHAKTSLGIFEDETAAAEAYDVAVVQAKRAALEEADTNFRMRGYLYLLSTLPTHAVSSASASLLLLLALPCSLPALPCAQANCHS